MTSRTPSSAVSESAPAEANSVQNFAGMSAERSHAVKPNHSSTAPPWGPLVVRIQTMARPPQR